MSELRIGAGRDLERIGLADLGRSSRRFPGLLGLFRSEVSPSYYMETDSGARLTCPCGRVVEVERYCLKECACGRWYLATERALRVWGECANSETSAGR